MQNVTHIVLAALLCMAGCALAAPAADDGRFPWIDDLEQARATAAEQSRPMLVVFRCEP
jgi:hypothetical protein